MKPTVIALFIVLFSASLFSQKLQKSSAPAVMNGWNFADINNVTAAISYDGVFADYRKSNGSGLFWPRGSGKSCVYTSGLWIVGKHRPTDSIRTAMMQYRSEFTPGKLISTFNTTTNALSAADSYGKDEYRLYRAVRNVWSGDALAWPVELGAPYIDSNGNGQYNPGIDSPFRWGDQLLWTVSNDVALAHESLVNPAPPMGLELQLTAFSYDVPDAMGNAVILRYKFMNKSDADYDSVSIGYFSDCDLGDANDDMIGCDTVRHLAFVYNGDEVDDGPNGYGIPPAVGFVLLQGPMVATGSMSDTARFEGSTMIGKKNLGMTAFVGYENSSNHSGWIDPPLGNVSHARIALNNLNGLVSYNGTPMSIPSSGQSTKFAFPGDPVTGAGWNHSDNMLAQDVRGVLGSGPFTLSKGDTQEIVIAFVAAQGSSRLNSLAALRTAVDTVRRAYLGDFSLGSLMPTTPRMYCDRTASAIPFKTTEVGRIADTVAIQFWNSGIDSLTLSFSSFNENAFLRVSPPLNALRLASGEGVNLRIVFAPAAVGTFADSLVITTNDPMKPRTVFQLTGKGVQIAPAASGVLYAVINFDIYTISPTTGSATLLFTPEQGFGGLLSIRPDTKEMYGLYPGNIRRIDAVTGSFIDEQLPSALSGFLGGSGFINDSVLVVSTDSAFILYDVVTRKVDTLVRYLDGVRPRYLAVHPSGEKIYFSRFSQFSKPDTVDAIYMYDLSAHTTTRIGRTLLNGTITGMHFDHSGTLYALSANSLITINTATGKGTMIGPTGKSGVRSLTMDPGSIAGVRPEPGITPSAFALYQNYPNPFNPSTVITYDVPSAGEVRLEVFDMLGRKAATLVREVQNAGRYSVRADAASLGLSSGVYIYSLRSGTFSAARKMSIVK